MSIKSKLASVLPDATLLLELDTAHAALAFFQENEFRIHLVVSNDSGEMLRIGKEWLLQPELVALDNALKDAASGRESTVLIRTTGLTTYLHKFTVALHGNLYLIELLFKTYIKSRLEDQIFTLWLNEEQLQQLSHFVETTIAVWSPKS